MIDTPHLTRTPARPAAVIRFTIPKDEIQSVMGPAFGELAATLAAQSIEPAGPFFSHHFRMDPAVYDFELGVPVDHPVTPTGRVTMSTLPAAAVVQTVYHGGYEGLGAAWGDFDAWIEREGHATGPNFWERYTVSPDTSPDPASWQTELNRPLAD